MGTELPYTKILPVNAKFESICKSFEEDMKGTACICEIYEITNHVLEEEYQKCKDLISEKRGKSPEEIIVYHGTTYSAAANIISTGFQTKYSTCAAYGKGTYASKYPLIALSYCKDTKTKADYSFIFICKFLKGKFGSPKSDNIIDTDLYDYSGSHDNDILVTPYDNGICPIYLIRYYKFA